MNSSGNQNHWLRAAHWLLGAAAALYVFSRFIPCVPVEEYPVYCAIDNGWTQGLHLAFAGHLQFGRDLVFTYGPWGFLARGYYPPTYLVSVGAWTILSLIFIGAGGRLARHFFNNRLLAALWLAGFTAAASLPAGNDFDTRLVAWIVLLLCLHFFVETGPFTRLQALLVFSLGWLGLVKFTGLIEGALVVAILAADNIFRHRRFPWPVPLWLASLLFFWVAAGQHLTSLAPFFINCWRITDGYTEAMMLSAKTGAGHMLWFFLIAVSLFAIAARLAWVRHRFWAVLPVAGLAAMLFIVFKLGYVRNDVHEITPAMTLILVALTGLPAAWPKNRRVAIAVFGTLVAACFFASAVFECWLPGVGLGRLFAGTFRPYHLLAPLVIPLTGGLESDYEKNLAAERAANPLPPVTGPTDLYSCGQNVLFANALPYQPRPVLQSYSAYTPELAEMNAAFLRSVRAPANILFAVQPVDGRFPALEDGRSWPELLTLYDLKKVAADRAGYLLLSRAPAPRTFRLAPLTNIIADFDQIVPLPAVTNGPVWVEIELKKNLAGKALATLYKPPVLVLNVMLSDRSRYSFRLIPGLAAGGFLLSPIIADARSFAALAVAGRRDLAGWEVTAMMVSADTESGFTRCYQSPFAIRFYRLDYPLQDFKIK